MEDMHKEISDGRIIFGYKKRYSYLVDAVIADVKVVDKTDYKLYAAVYEYFYEGKTYRGEGELFRDEVQKGEYVDLYIDPNNPADFNGKHRKRDFHCQAEIIYSISVILFFLVIGGYSLLIEGYIVVLIALISIILLVLNIIRNKKKMERNRYM